MKVGEIFVALGFDVDDQKLEQFDNKVSGLKKNIRNLIITVTAALFAIDRFVDSSVRGAVALRNFELATGRSAEALQRWQIAANLANIDADAQAVTASIRGLEDALTAIRFGGGNISPFAIMGLDIAGKNAFDIIEQLRAVQAAYDPQTFSYLVKQMGVSEDFLPILKASNQEFEEFMRISQGLTRSKGVQESLMRTGTAVNLLKQELLLFKDKVVVALEPVWKAIIKGVRAVMRAFEGLYHIIRSLDPLWDGMAEGIKIILPLLGLMMLQIRPLTTALAALLLLLEDFAVYKRGGVSVIGTLLEDSGLKKMLGKFGENYGLPIFDKIEKFNRNIVAPYIKENQRLAAEEKAKKRGIQSPAKTGTATPEEQNDMIRELYGDDDRALPVYPDFEDQTPLFAPQSAPAPSVSPQSKNVTFDNEFHISSTGSPDEVARQIQSRMQTQLNYGLSDFNNGAVV